MPNESKAVEEAELGNETWWCVKARQIADALINGQPIDMLRIEAKQRRDLEHQNVAMSTRFSSILRQLADADLKGRDLNPLLRELVSLRHRELGPTVDVTDRLELRERGR